MKVVVVDDERKIRNGLVKRIEAHVGWEVIGAFESGRDALSFLRVHPADIVVTDIRMPGISGLELISGIREINRDVQIIILSGYGEFAYAQRAIELGVRRYLTKPTNIAELIAALEEAESELLRREDEPASTDTSNFAASEIVAYIKQNYSNKITLHDISSALNLSPNYLCRLFKRHMGKGPMENLLDVYEKTAVAIAQERGLDDSRAVRAFANSWDDVALGKQMAEQMIDNGADTLFVYANEVGLGSIEAARSKGAKFIGFSGDQTVIDPDTVVASVIFDFKTFYVWAVSQFIAGDLRGNLVHEAGINEGIFEVIYTENIGEEIRSAVDSAIAAFQAGGTDLTAMFEG